MASNVLLWLDGIEYITIKKKNTISGEAPEIVFF